MYRLRLLGIIFEILENNVEIVEALPNCVPKKTQTETIITRCCCKRSVDAEYIKNLQVLIRGVNEKEQHERLTDIIHCI